MVARPLLDDLVVTHGAIVVDHDLSDSPRNHGLPGLSTGELFYRFQRRPPRHDEVFNPSINGSPKNRSVYEPGNALELRKGFVPQMLDVVARLIRLRDSPPVS